MRPPGFEPGSPAFFTTHLWEAEVLDQARPRPHVDHVVMRMKCSLKVLAKGTFLEGEGKCHVFASLKADDNGGRLKLGSVGRLRRI